MTIKQTYIIHNAYMYMYKIGCEMFQRRGTKINWDLKNQKNTYILEGMSIEKRH